ncbi:MAG: hypothetical protein ACLQGU_23230 [bacterium]
MRWLHTVNIKHLLTEDEDYESVKKAMNEIADILSKEKCFKDFASTIEKFRGIPEDDDFVEYANDLLDEMYSFADKNRIWIA